MRKEYQAGHLSAVQIARCEALGFDFAPMATVWQRNFERLQAYVKGGGDPNRIPTAHPLRSWLRHLRVSYRKGTLPLEKRRLLTQLGVDWHKTAPPSPEDIWQERFEQLKAYKKAYGHLNVSKEQDEKLYNWLKEQGRLRREGRLQAGRLAALDALGLDWEPGKTSWLERYFEDTLQRLAQHRAEHGSCVIPNKPGFRLLQQRAVRLRKEYRAGHLSVGQIACCEALGFDFDPRQRYGKGASKCCRPTSPVNSSCKCTSEGAIKKLRLESGSVNIYGVDYSTG